MTLAIVSGRSPSQEESYRFHTKSILSRSDRSAMNTKLLIRSLALAAGLLAAQVGMAQAPAGAPAGTTGLCKDGTYYSGASKQGACRGHQGVKEWYGAPASSGKAAPAATTPAPAPATTSKAAPASAATTTPAPAKSAPATTAKAATTAPAPGGGADKVWLNGSTNVYHCPGTKYYGTTKSGSYMSEADAKAKGAHPDHGKPCK